MRVCACRLVIELLFVLVWLGLYVDVHACVCWLLSCCQNEKFKDFFSFSIIKVWRIRNDVAIEAGQQQWK